MLTIDSVRVFVTASECRSFSAAAKKIGRTQAAISNTIQNLEIDLNTSLFDRSNKYPTLTASAKHILPYARDLLEAYEEFLIRSSQPSENMIEEITIGLDPKVHSASILKGLYEFLDSLPFIHLRVVQRGSGELDKMLLAKEIDLAIGTFVDLDLSTTTMRSIKLGSVRGLWVGAPEYFTSEQMQSPSKLHRTTLITPLNGSPSVLQELLYCDRHVEMECMQSTRAMTKRGLGVSYLPYDFVKNDLERGSLIELPSFVERDNNDRWPVYLKVVQTRANQLPYLELLVAYQIEKGEVMA
ncbi:LysR family transcriptional regulator [Vibrio sp. FNV 38]|nr:LysR family transcriptional regulator [Vibrio sp. FNV 38]